MSTCLCKNAGIDATLTVASDATRSENERPHECLLRRIVQSVAENNVYEFFVTSLWTRCGHVSEC